jgi:hypothetical protein
MAITNTKKIRVLKGQNLYDLGVQIYGAPEGVFILMRDNPLKIENLNTILTPGDYLVISPDKIIRKEIVSMFQMQKRTVNTGDEIDPLGDFNDDFDDDFLI